MKRPWLVFILIGLAILGPLLLPGYVLTLDMKWTPQLHPPQRFDNAWLFYAPLHYLNLIIPSMLIQKILLLGTFVMAGVGAYRLARERAGGWPAYLAGLVYAVNPFAYTRLMAGQYLVLLGYALLPWLVQALVGWLEKPDLRRAAKFGGWLIAIGLISIHALGLAALLILSITLAWGWGRWRKLSRRLVSLAGVAAGWLVVNAFWLVPVLLGRSPIARDIATFGHDQFTAYATTAGGAGVLLNVLALQGFWTDPLGRYALPSATGWLFWTAFVALMALVGLGIWRAVARRDRLGLGLAAAGLVAWVLAMGVAWSPVAGLTHWLAGAVPFYQGYREPHKWAAVLALVYAYMAALGAAWLREQMRGWTRAAVMIAVLLIPLAWVPMLLWGAAGQLRSAEYPASWHELNQRLNAEPGEFKVLMLPWHQYLTLDFAGRTVANPAPAFFDRPVISSDNPELLGVRPRTRHPENDVIEGRVLSAAYYSQTAGAKLAPLGVHYVVLLKQADWAEYGWLDDQTDLKLAAETSGWKLYRVQEAKP